MRCSNSISSIMMIKTIMMVVVVVVKGRGGGGGGTLASNTCQVGPNCRYHRKRLKANQDPSSFLSPPLPPSTLVPTRHRLPPHSLFAIYRLNDAIFHPSALPLLRLKMAFSRARFLLGMNVLLFPFLSFIVLVFHAHIPPCRT